MTLTKQGTAGELQATTLTAGDAARVLPVLVCGEGPESATKTSPEYRLVSLDLEPSDGHPR